MNKQFRSCSLDQPFLLPPCLQDWLPENHLARFVAEVVGQLDLTSIYECYERKDGRGLAAYHPEMLTRLLLTELEHYWKEQVDQLLRRASAVDEKENRDEEQAGATGLPEELALAQNRLKRLEQAKREVEQEAQQKLEEAQREWSSRGKRGRPRKGQEPPLRTSESHKQRKRYYRALQQCSFSFPRPESHRPRFATDAR